jgi:hypothetical protein
MLPRWSWRTLAALFFVFPGGSQAAELPNTLKEAASQGFEVVAVVGQNASNQDHVIYLKKGSQLLICGFRVVLTERGFDAEKSGNIGVCTGFQ